MRRDSFQPGWVLFALLACCTATPTLHRSQAYAAEGNYYLAYKVLESERNPDNPEGSLEEAYWQARLDFLIDQARRRIFHNREEEALVDLHQAQAQDPANEVVVDLIVRAENKLAARATAAGSAHLDAGDLELALLSFSDALRRVPGYPAALQGTQLVRVAFDKLHATAQRHFLEAIRKYPDDRMIEVDWHATAALESDPSRDDARDLQQKALRRLAERAMERAAASEARGVYGAALMEYRSVRDLDPGIPGTEERIAHMEREVEAEAIMEKAFMKVLTKEYGEARKLLDQAFELTVLEKSRISELVLRTRRSEGEERYQRAYDLELQGKKQEALEGYTALAAEWPNGLQDEKARIDALSIDIAAAEEAYAAGVEAEAKDDLAAAAQHFTSAVRAYGLYKDAAERLARVKARLQ